MFHRNFHLLQQETLAFQLELWAGQCLYCEPKLLGEWKSLNGPLICEILDILFCKLSVKYSVELEIILSHRNRRNWKLSEYANSNLNLILALNGIMNGKKTINRRLLMGSRDLLWVFKLRTWNNGKDS